MRAPRVLLPRMISLSLLVCAMMLADVSPAHGAERPPTASDPRGSQGLPLRPYQARSGVLSAALGEGNGAAANRPTTRTSPPATGNRSAAAERTKGLVPQFMSIFSSKVPQPKPTSRGPARVSTSATAGPYARSSNPARQGGSSANSATGRGQPTGRAATTGQDAYRTAAAAQSYHYPGASVNSPASARTHSGASRQTLTALAQRSEAYSPSARPPAQRGSPPPTSATAATLIEAHRLAKSATAEAQFSRVFLTCREVAIGSATPEETAFAKELASWALNRRGQIKAAAGRTDDALADFDTAIGLDPKRWRAIHNRGVLLAQSGHFEQAFDDFHRTTKLNPRFAKAFSNRAALYTVAGDPEAALRDYQRAVELDPELAVAQRGLGRTCHLLGMTGEALEHLDSAVALAPGDAAALVSRGDLLTDLGRYADAADDYERALAINAESVDACRSSAWLLATCPDEAIRNPELALRRAELAVRREQKADAETYNVLAAAQASAGNYQRAAQTVQRAMDLAPASERAVYEDRLEMYRQAQPLRIAPLDSIQQAQYRR